MANISDILKKIRRKSQLIKKAENKFLASVKTVENTVQGAILKLLKGFSSKEGKLVNDDSTTDLIKKLNGEVSAIVKRSKYGNAINELLPNYELLEKLNEDIYSSVLNEKVLLSISPIRAELLKDITASLASQSALNAQFIKPIRLALLQAISFGHTFEDTEKNLKQLITGNGQKLGRLSQYTSQIVRDGLLQWDGAINDKIRDEYELEFFRYVGTEVEDSRPFCIHMLEGSGKFADLAISAGVYRVEDIPKIVQRGRGGKGWNPNTTVSNFAIMRGGFNCRHAILFF